LNLAPAPRGLPLFPGPVAQLACARLPRTCAAVAAADAAAICIPIIERLSLHRRRPVQLGDGDASDSTGSAAPVSGESGRALFAAALCVGRWGELLRIVKASEAEVLAAEASLSCTRDAALKAQCAADSELEKASAPSAVGGPSRAEGVSAESVAHIMDPALAGVPQGSTFVHNWVWN
jgi:hypothetical protein